jgi:hypothetical protein
MPTYKNITSRRQTVNGKVIEPGDTICLLHYLDENVSNLLKVDDRPFYNPVVLSTVVNCARSVDLPKKDNLGKPVDKYAIHFHVQQGSMQINYNSPDSEPGLLLYEGARWNIRCFERNIEKLYFKPLGDTGAVIYIIVEKL